MKGYMYILLCANGNYYTGSTNDIERRLTQHQNGEGANFTKKHLPVELVYFEEFERIDEAFYREKQVQGWSRKKKEALIKGEHDKLPGLARNYTQYGASTSSAPEASTSSAPEASTSSAPEASTGSAPEASTSSAPEASTGSAPGNGG